MGSTFKDNHEFEFLVGADLLPVGAHLLPSSGFKMNFLVK